MIITTAPKVNRKGVNWVTAIAFVIFHILSVVALFFFSWPAVDHSRSAVLRLAQLWHRYGLPPIAYASRIQDPKPLEYFLAVCGTLALEGGPISWVATHRIHHQLLRSGGQDPHTPRDGAWWAHLLWMVRGDALHCDAVTTANYAPDLAKDRFYVWLTKYHWVPLTTVGVLLLVFGGIPFVLWGIFFRVTLGNACHLDGQLRS